jgi:hypothetical protein
MATLERSIGRPTDYKIGLRYCSVRRLVATLVVRTDPCSYGPTRWLASVSTSFAMTTAAKVTHRASTRERISGPSGFAEP